MHEHRLNQTLLLKPSHSFHTINQTLQALGWEKNKPLLDSNSLIEGEPEHVTWSWQGCKPFIVYTFNPVAKLRVLDVATLPPVKRGEIVRQFELIDDEAIENYCQSSDPRQRLLGLWSIQECQRLDLLALAQSLCADDEAIVKKESEKVVGNLQHLADERVSVLSSLRLIATAAEKLIRDIRQHPQLVSSLAPNLEDCENLFDAHLASPIHQAITKVYQSIPNLDPGPSYSHLEVNAAHAGLLRWPNELSERFPRAYRDLAGWMKPDKIWMCWAWVAPLASELKTSKDKASGQLKVGEFSKSPKRISYDGLVWAKYRWVWFPKMHRIVMPIVASRLNNAVAVH